MAQLVLCRYRPRHPELTPEDCPTCLLWHTVLVYGPVSPYLLVLDGDKVPCNGCSECGGVPTQQFIP